MPRQARGESIDPREVQVVHCIQRCVRRAFLCGTDPQSGNSYEHRRQWIHDRMEFLSSVFAIDCLTFAIMSNHIHVILRTRYDISQNWTDEEVAKRWLQLHPRYRQPDRPAGVNSELAVQWLTGNKELIQAIRLRLSDVSWWMRSLAQPIAVQANKEDQCTGRFWEGRFKCQILLDEAAVLACASYVDLNPIRAAMAQTLESSEHTGIKDRIDDLTDSNPRNISQTQNWERSQKRARSGWLSPIERLENKDGKGICSDGRRASKLGFLPISLTRYLELLDWTARQLVRNKQGTTPKGIRPILKRLGLEVRDWCELISKFSKVFKRVAGKAESLAEEASRRNQHWLQAPGSPI